MNNIMIRNCIENAQDKVTDFGARVLVDATNFTGRMMNTGAGRFALAVHLAINY